MRSGIHDGNTMSWRLGLFLAFIAGISAFEVGLGFWQWNRRAEKAAFISTIEAASRLAPRPWIQGKLWDRVVLKGRYLDDKTFYVRSSRPQAGFGVYVLTPLLTRQCDAGGHCGDRAVYINRGFVPTPPNGQIPRIETPAGEVELAGFLRPSEHAGLFPPRNEPAKQVFFFRTIEEMARLAALPGADGATPSPYTVFVDRQGEAGEVMPPFGIDVKTFLAAIPNNHLEYALTWWALAATNGVVLAFFLLARRKKGEASR